MSVYIHMSVCIDICITSYDKMCVYTYIFTHITSNDDSPIIKQTNKQTKCIYLFCIFRVYSIFSSLVIDVYM